MRGFKTKSSFNKFLFFIFIIIAVSTSKTPAPPVPAENLDLEPNITAAQWNAIVALENYRRQSVDDPGLFGNLNALTKPLFVQAGVASEILNRMINWTPPQIQQFIDLDIRSIAELSGSNIASYRTYLLSTVLDANFPTRMEADRTRLTVNLRNAAFGERNSIAFTGTTPSTDLTSTEDSRFHRLPGGTVSARTDVDLNYGQKILGQMQSLAPYGGVTPKYRVVFTDSEGYLRSGVAFDSYQGVDLSVALSNFLAGNPLGVTLLPAHVTTLQQIYTKLLADQVTLVINGPVILKTDGTVALLDATFGTGSYSSFSGFQHHYTSLQALVDWMRKGDRRAVIKEPGDTTIVNSGTVIRSNGTTDIVLFPNAFNPETQNLGAYQQLIDRLREGSVIEFSDGTKFKLGSYIGSGETTLIWNLADNPGFVIRIPKPEVIFADRPETFYTSRWVNSFIEGSKALQEKGVPIVGIKGFARNQYIVVEKIQPTPGFIPAGESTPGVMTLTDYLESTNPALRNNPIFEIALATFIPKLDGFDDIGDFALHQVLWDPVNSRWVLGDWSEFHEINPTAKGEVLIGNYMVSFVESSNLNIQFWSRVKARLAGGGIVVPAPTPKSAAEIAAANLKTGKNLELPTVTARSSGKSLINMPFSADTFRGVVEGVPLDVYVGDVPRPGYSPRDAFTVQIEVPTSALTIIPGSNGQVEVPGAAVKAALGNGVTGFNLNYSATDPLGSLEAMATAYSLYPSSLSGGDARINAAILNANNAASGLIFNNGIEQLSFDAMIAGRVTASVQLDLEVRQVPSFGGAGAVAGTVYRPISTGVGYQVVSIPYSNPSVMEAVGPTGSLMVIKAPAGSPANAALQTAASQLGLSTSVNWSGVNNAGGAVASWNYVEAKINEGFARGLSERWGIKIFSGENAAAGGKGIFVKMGNVQVVGAAVAPTGQGYLRGQALFAVRTGDLNSSGASRTVIIDFARATPSMKSIVAVGATAAMIALPGIIGAGMHRITQGTWDGAGGAALDSQIAALKSPVWDVTTGVNTVAGLSVTRTFQNLAAKHALVKAGGLLAVEAVPIVNVAAAVIAAPDIAGEYEKLNVQYFGAPNPVTATPRERLLSDTVLDKVMTSIPVGGPVAMGYLRAGQAWNIYIREGDDFNVKTAYLQQLALTLTQPQDRFEALYFDKLGLGRRNSHVNRLGGDITTLYEQNFNKPLETQLRGSMPSGKTLSSMESALRVNADKIKNEVKIRESFAAGRNFRDGAQWQNYSADAERAKVAVQDFRKKVDEAAKNNNYQIPEQDDAIVEAARDRGSVLSGANSNISKPIPDGKILDGAAADYNANYDFVVRGADIRPDPNFPFTNYMKALLGPDRVFYPNGFVVPNQRKSRNSNSDWVGSYNDAADWAKYLDAAANRSADVFGQYRDVINGINAVYDGKSGNINGGIPPLPTGDENSWYGNDYNFYLPGYSGYP